MILDELFEADLPPNIKKSDLPPGRRAPLTMRDVEAERPRSPFRYQVGDKQFMDLRAAQEFASGTGEKVVPLNLEEQAQDPDVVRGMANLRNIENNANNANPVRIQNETGVVQFQVVDPEDKEWVINHAKEWIDAGKGKDLYRLMGTAKGFDFLVRAWEKEDAIRARAQTPEPEPEQDMFAPAHVGAPKSPRMQSEAQTSQKKNPDIAEAPRGAVTARTQRMLDRIRARQPQATSDLEAMAYELQDAERRDAEEIDKLEKDVDNLETDIKQDLQRRIDTLTKRRGTVKQAAAADTKTDQMIDQINRANDAQQREINNLEKAVASLAQQRAAVTVPPPVRTKTPTPAVKPSQPDVRMPAPQNNVIDIRTAKKQTNKTDKTPANKLDKFTVPDDERAVAEGEVAMAKSALGTLGRTLGILKKSPSQYPSFDQALVEPIAVPPQAKPRGLSPQQQRWQRGQELKQRRQQTTQASTTTSGADAAAPVATGTMVSQTIPTPAQAPGWKMGDPITIGGQILRSGHPQYQKIAQQMMKQGIKEAKKKPTPTNPSLWSRAKAAAKSKFDVYPSAYANAWAAKWYKAKGGGWRMGKGAKK